MISFDSTLVPTLPRLVESLSELQSCSDFAWPSLRFTVVGPHLCSRLESASEGGPPRTCRSRTTLTLGCPPRLPPSTMNLGRIVSPTRLTGQQMEITLEATPNPVVRLQHGSHERGDRTLCGSPRRIILAHSNKRIDRRAASLPPVVGVWNEALAAKEVVEALRSRVRSLETRERRLRRQLAAKKEIIDDTEVVAESAQNELAKARDTISHLEASFKEYKDRSAQYERWWLTDNRSLKVVVDMIPVHDREALQEIMTCSKARYSIYSTAPF
ncbi:hypothetical protein NMY22_g19745 [Coprinellus aureogranulatus]|nr:hypothetical protein NMY22_g19745 [Coprinellus aureogranulatus]